MKRAFPGDPEFSRDSFHQLPYEYVLSAYHKHWGMNREDLHNRELPVALLTSVYANSQRNPKTQKKPFDLMDFCVFSDADAEDAPAQAAAAAYMKLASDGDLPSWALFCFKDMKYRAKGKAPALVALSGEDAILLAPEEINGSYFGLLIAAESASEQKRKLTLPSGRAVWVQLPKVNTKFIAEDGVELPIV